MKNILSIDVESWVHFLADIFGEYRNKKSSERKGLDDDCVPRAIDYILRALEAHGASATFFVSGEVFEWYPETIHSIARAGHEIGYHTHDHVLLTNRETLAEQARKSRNFLDAFKPVGFRAPQIYLCKECIPLLRELGFEYSSSTYGPFRRRRSGGEIEEIPVSALEFFHGACGPVAYPSHLTFKMLTRQIPFGSGLFLPLLRSFVCGLISRINGRGEPAVIFLHPWQVYAPRQTSSLVFKLRLALRNPLAIPYAFSIAGLFETILRRHEFISFKEFRNGYQGVLGQQDHHLGRLDVDRRKQEKPGDG